MAYDPDQNITMPFTSIEDTTILGEGKSETNWRYEIQYGPEGEDTYAWIYKDGQFIATMKTWHAREIVEAMNAHPSLALAEQGETA